MTAVQAAREAVAGDTAPTVPAECTGGVRVPTTDQAWPPFALDLHAAVPRRKDRPIVLATPAAQTLITMKILPLFVLLACVAWQACAQDEKAAAPARGLLKRGPLSRNKSPITTTTPAPQEEAEYEDEEVEYEEEKAQQEPSTEAPPTSTEGKKLVGSGVRPFRSNTDLLETLKRRRAQVAEAKLRAHSNSDATPAPESPVEPAKSSYSKKRFNNSPAKEENSEESNAPKQSNRGRFGKRPATRSVQAEVEEEVPASTPVRNGRTFARRGN